MNNKAVLISIHPDWVEHIFIRKDKIYEVRKRAPLLTPPYKVYVYCTLKQPFLKYENMFWKGTLNGLVVGEFTCIHNWERSAPWHNQSRGTCLTDRQLANYSMGNDLVFMEIENPVLFNNPKELKEFNINRPPQNFYYCKELEDG